MPRLGVDLTAVGLIPDKTVQCQVAKLEYQIKVGDKWNKEGTKAATFEEFITVADELKRLHFTIAVPGHGNIFNDLYMKESALGFTQNFMKACGVAYDSTGFDPEDAVGKSVMVEITTSDDPDYGPTNNYKFSRV